MHHSDQSIPFAEEPTGKVVAGAHWQDASPRTVEQENERELLVARVVALIVVAGVLVALANAAIWLLDSLPQ